MGNMTFTRGNRAGPARVLVVGTRGVEREDKRSAKATDGPVGRFRWARTLPEVVQH
jgi:hypothetical protein